MHEMREDGAGWGLFYLSTCWEMVEIPGDRAGSAPAASAVHRRTRRLRREARGMTALSAASHSRRERNRSSALGERVRIARLSIFQIRFEELTLYV